MNKRKAITSIQPMSETKDQTVGRVYKFRDIDLLPTRKDFIKKAEKKIVDGAIENEAPLRFLPTDMNEEHFREGGCITCNGGDRSRCRKIAHKAQFYKIRLIGVLEDGSPAHVILDNIYPYFEVRFRGLENEINVLEDLAKTGLRPYRHKLFKARAFKFYDDEQSEYLRLYYTSDKDRTNAMSVVHSKGYETATNDAYGYYKVVCRDYRTTFSTWAELTDYKVHSDSPKAKFWERTVKTTERVFRLSIDNFKKFENISDTHKRYKTLCASWDIETTTYSDDLPMPENEKDRTYMCGIVFSWSHEVKPFYRVALSQFDSAPGDNFDTIVCGTERNIIKAIGLIMKRMKPEFIHGFNDSDYDWNFIVVRARRYAGTLLDLARNLSRTNLIGSDASPREADAAIAKYNYKSTQVKIDAQLSVDARSLKLPGYLPVDARICYRKLYSKAEYSSLSFFLEECKLANKDDMPYTRMTKSVRAYEAFIDRVCGLPEKPKAVWEYCDPSEVLGSGDGDDPDPDAVEFAAHKQEMMLINKYCIVDAERCHDLMKIRNVITDAREVADMAYVSLFDAFYRADGMKVRNLTVAIGQQPPFNLRVDMRGSQNRERGKYPGAFVFRPKKGMQISKLSIEERVRKANSTANPAESKASPAESKVESKVESKTESKTRRKQANDNAAAGFPSDLTEIYKFINNYGAVLTEKQLNAIEDNEDAAILRNCPAFRKFIQEPIGRPIVGLDFASLYPSIIRAYNLSPEYCILDPHEAKIAQDAGHKLTQGRFTYNAVPRNGYFIQHENRIKDPKAPDFKFGIFPYVLDDLFNKRVAVKRPMNVYKDRIKELEKEIGILHQKGQTPTAEMLAELEHKSFEYGYLNSKQGAIKVFMNTFYGETGAQNSPFFIVELAGTVTAKGRLAIMMAFVKVKELGCDVKYGDTDSLYISVAENTFADLDKLYYTGRLDKLDYWTQMVERTKVEIGRINKIVDKMFFDETANNFLKMAYEEVLYPVNFTGKKKYYGVEHENLINFFPKKLFIRGLEVKKRGVSNILRETFSYIMKTGCSHTNLYDTEELIRAKIHEIYTRSWSYKDFELRAMYRPNKKNISVLKFVARMLDRGVKIPGGERFSYVIVKKFPKKFTTAGRAVNLGVGEKMEPLDEAMERKMELDLDHYMKGSVNTQFVRLMMYHERFHVDPVMDLDGGKGISEASLDAAEDKIQKNAAKYIKAIVSKYYTPYNDVGAVHRSVYNDVSKYISVPDDTNLDERAQDEAPEYVKGYGKQYIDRLLHAEGFMKKGMARAKNKRIAELQDAYYAGRDTILQTRLALFKKTHAALQVRARNNRPLIKEVTENSSKVLEAVMDRVKKRIRVSDYHLAEETKERIKLTDIIDKADYEKILNEEVGKYNEHSPPDAQVKQRAAHGVYLSILGNYVYKERVESICEYLKSFTAQRMAIANDDAIAAILASSVNMDLSHLDI